MGMKVLILLNGIGFPKALPFTANKFFSGQVGFLFRVKFTLPDTHN